MLWRCWFSRQCSLYIIVSQLCSVLDLVTGRKPIAWNILCSCALIQTFANDMYFLEVFSGCVTL